MRRVAGNIGEQISVLRQQQGLTQEAFASALGVSRSSVAQWESGRGGETQHLQKIAEVLDVSIELFLNGLTSNVTTVAVTVDELRLLQLYRRCSVSERIAIVQFVNSLEEKSLPRGL